MQAIYKGHEATDMQPIYKGHDKHSTDLASEEYMQISMTPCPNFLKAFSLLGLQNKND